MGVATSAAWQDVADLIDRDSGAPERREDDRQVAVKGLQQLLEVRIEAVLDVRPDPPGLMLSGGVDSMVVGAMLTRLGYSPTCVTVAVGSAGKDELDAAKEFARFFGLPHLVVDLDDSRLAQYARECVAALGMTELWEIAAAIPIRASFEKLRSSCATGAIFTGGGADVLLGGGIALSAPLHSEMAREQVRQQIWGQVLRSFSVDRLVPDFFTKVLGQDSQDFIKVFQTVDFWDFTARLGPTNLFDLKLNGWIDKACLRDLAFLLGVPDELATRPKDPLQRSAGVFSGLAALARKQAAMFDGATTYSNPLNEPTDQVLARYYLRTMQLD